MPSAWQSAAHGREPYARAPVARAIAGTSSTRTVPASVLDRPLQGLGRTGGHAERRGRNEIAPASDVAGAVQQVALLSCPTATPTCVWWEKPELLTASATAGSGAWLPWPMKPGRSGSRQGGAQWQDKRRRLVREVAPVVSPRRPSVDPGSRGAWDVERVKDAVAAMLVRRAPDINLVARALRTSRRTLQRRLRGAGLAYVELVAEVRRQAAERLLQDPTRKVADVARELGYSDPAHFTRAFSRWTGVSPRSFRIEHGRAGSDDPDSAPQPAIGGASSVSGGAGLTGRPRVRRRPRAPRATRPDRPGGPAP